MRIFAESLPDMTGITRKEEITTAFLQLVDEHIADLLQQRTSRRYSTSDFARLLFIQSRHLTNTITETTGKSPCDIMEARVLAETEKLLQHTSLSVADIGERFGWEDASNFIKFFKGMSGITPLQYRKKLPAS